MVEKFTDWYDRTVKGNATVDLNSYDRRPSAVAHSLGSWIIGNAMLKYDHIRFDKLVFAGSILPKDFDWATLFAKDQVAFVRNECGQQDPWPKWARRFVARAGTGGSEGFEWFSNAVQNVRCDWFGHSDALMRPHIEQHWIPLFFQSPSPSVIRHGREINDGDQFSKTLNRTALIDDKVFGHLPHYPQAQIPRGLALTWIKVNPDIYTFLIDRQNGEPVGYINAMPVNDQLYRDIQQGKTRDNDVTAAGILPYLGGQSLKIYFMSLAIKDEYRRWGEGIQQQGYVQLLTGLLDKLTYYAKSHGIRVSHFLGAAWTDEGKKICENLFGMTQVGSDKDGDPIFELDIDALRANPSRRIMPALKRLIKVYEQFTS